MCQGTATGRHRAAALPVFVLGAENLPCLCHTGLPLSWT